MTPEERLQYIDMALRVLNVQVHKSILEIVIKAVDLVNEKKGSTDIKDILNLKK